MDRERIHMTATINTKRLPQASRDLTRFEFFLLCAFLFFLPLAEAPKNFFLYSLFGVWAYGCAKRKNWGVNTPFFEWPLAFIVITSFVPVFFRQSDQIRALNNCVDFLSIALLMVLVARSRLSPIRSCWLFAWTSVGVCVAVIYGFWRGGQFPSLHSVGHINQVAIYLGILTITSIGALFFTQSKREVVVYAAVVGLFGFLLISTGSRNALLGNAFTAALIPVLGFLTRMRARAFMATPVLTLAVAIAFIFQPTALVRQINQTASNKSIVDDARQSLWRSSYLVAQSGPLFGYGVGFFGEGHSPQRIERLVKATGASYHEKDYVWTNHAHNLFLNWLVERGWIATVVFLTWILFVIFSLASEIYRRRGILRSGPLSDFVGLLVLTSTVFFGIGNTSWHHEHGMLAAVLIGIAWGLKTQKSVPSPRPALG
jgi:O-antigen ligase